MSLFARLFLGAASRRPPPPIPDEIEIQFTWEETDSDPRSEPYADLDLGEAEGQSFIIEYTDAEGRESTRRITVRRIDPGGGAPMLRAYCYERKASRSFRIDRIRSVIDLDGVVHDDPAGFLTETFGMDPEFARLVGTNIPVRPSGTMPKAVRQHVQLLVVLAQADDWTDKSEIEAIAESCAPLFTEAGLEYDASWRRRVVAYAKRLRPSERQIEQACAVLDEMEGEQVLRFYGACKAVVAADGVVTPEEIAAMQAIFAPFLEARGVKLDLA